jgi:PilZ domain
MYVLALEPDAAQADAIRHVVCNLVGARLTVATSIDHALHLLHQSVPDLVLQPALVSPTQETTLIEALRLLPGASHVETLITPVLPARDRGLIVTPQGWRRWTSRRTPAGHATSAEAGAFAERVHWAIERARERKAHAVAVERHQPVSEPHVEPATDMATGETNAPEALLELGPAPVEAMLIEEPRLVAPVSASIDVTANDTDASRSLLQLFDRVDAQRVPDAQDLDLQDATSRLLEKLAPASASDRRQYRRFAARELPGLRSARIKFGPHVALVDVSAGGALLETDARLQPESEALLELVGSAGQAVVPFRVVRCQIAALNGPPRYLGACAFKQPLDLDELAWTSGDTAFDVKIPALTLVPPRPVVRNAW